MILNNISRDAAGISGGGSPIFLSNLKNLMKPKTAKSLVRDVVDYSPAVPRNPVQTLALARVQAPAPAPHYNAQEIGDFAARWLVEHKKGTSREICQALYGYVDDHNLRVIGNALAARMRKLGDICYIRSNTHSPEGGRNVWFLVDPGKPVHGQVATLREIVERLARLEAGQDRLLRILTSIFRHQEWPE